jgi:hypothetical protein
MVSKSKQSNPDQGSIDARFAKVSYDPRFLKPKKNSTKVEIDDRFSELFKSEEFTSGATVDKYGRPVKADTGLMRYYKLKDSEIPDLALRARGEAVIESSSEEDDHDVEETIEGGLFGNEDVPTGEETYRFAVVNLDWDHVKAKDIFMLFDGFKKDGIVKSVRIYPSDFGKERMKQEDMSGPPAQVFEREESLLQQDDGKEFDDAKLRRYQLDRLKYYYAIVECDSVKTAKHIYKNCDGAEFESSSNFLDLRYVPDETEFDNEIR